MGHPTNYLGKEMRWNVINNSLTYVRFGENEYKYKYTSGGKRIQKKTNQGTTDYIYSGDVLLSEITDKDRLNYYYDSEGNVIEIGYQKFDGADYGAETRYFYTRNGQGDIIGIYRCSDSVRVGSYEYDLWGNLISISKNDAPKVNVKDDVFILKRNPLRYRGYYYDSETKFYYLNSRYYDPAVHRFISADSICNLATEGDVLSYNLFSYCMNNPINRLDENGGFSISNKTKMAIGAVSTALAIGITVAIGASLAPVISTIAISALIGGAFGFANDGVSGIQDGLIDGFMWGGITALGGAALKGAKVFAATHGSPNSIGKIGEKLAGIDPTQKVPIKVNGKVRIPDGLTKDVLTEVKNVKYISNTSQLRDFAQYANNKQMKYELWVRPTTKIAKTVIDAGWDIKYLW